MDSEFLLVVDDDPLLLDTCRMVLEDAGVAAVCMNSAAEAEHVLFASPESVKALLTDVSLSVGSDGWQLAQRAREIRNDLPVVYITGAASDEANTRRVPNSTILFKPFSSAQLVGAIRRLT